MPKIPLEILVLPWPARPPMPSISPLRTFKDTSFVRSPGILTLRCSMSRIISLFSKLRFTLIMLSASSLRPTISSAIWFLLVFFVFSSNTICPSRRITTESARVITSSSRWLMKMTAMPSSATWRIHLRNRSASLSVNTAVGSSRTRSFKLLLSISLAISTNCICPTGSLSTVTSGLISIPSL